MPAILVIDDERPIRNSLKDILEFEGYAADTAEDGAKGLELFRSGSYDMVFADIKMPEIDGMELLAAIVAESDTPVVMISGHGSLETAVESIKIGAFDYIAKPLDLNRVLVTVKNALDRKKLSGEAARLKKKINLQYEMVGQSAELDTIRQMIAKIAPTDARVLITGPNGCGKELVARAVHEQSNRAGAPFVEVNCAAIPSELIESELFGHEKGAFTSAVKTRKGKFEQAEGGTIFLDEIGDMSLSAQAKVLRALQENKITRVGADKDLSVDVRVLAATNKDLKAEIAAGRFREDLYHRLSVILVKVPALKDRPADIPILALHFASQICAGMGTQPKEFQPEALAALQGHQWTGNIRELRNVVERLIILCGRKITSADVDAYI
jgi:two-component system, NtrC family, nitrogen regulation response regulator NtrX